MNVFSFLNRSNHGYGTKHANRLRLEIPPYCLIDAEEAYLHAIVKKTEFIHCNSCLKGHNTDVTSEMDTNDHEFEHQKNIRVNSCGFVVVIHNQPGRKDRVLHGHVIPPTSNSWGWGAEKQPEPNAFREVPL